MPRIYELDEQAFDNLNPHSEYWAGMLISDGNIHGNCITLALKSSDAHHVGKFKRFLKTDAPITQRDNPKGDKMFSLHRLRVHSEHMVGRLAELGIWANKSADAEACQELARSRHFWRGAIDGDGSVGWFNPKVKGKVYRQPRLTYCASPPLMEQFLDYVEAMSGFRYAIDQAGPVVRMGVNGRPAVSLISHLYDGAEDYLDRKMIEAIEIHGWAELKGDKHKRTKLTKQQTEEIIRRFRAGETAKQIATAFGVKPSDIYNRTKKDRAVNK